MVVPVFVRCYWGYTVNDAIVQKHYYPKIIEIKILGNATKVCEQLKSNLDIKGNNYQAK